MSKAIFAGLVAAGAAVAGRYAVHAWKRIQSLPARPRIPRHMAGGFEPEMTREEAFQILGLRKGASLDSIRSAHRRLMLLNHPDSGGSTVIASKVNEAKDLLLGKRPTRTRL
ncbi:hypothetical protein GAYE_SCF39G5333 [Galdieria yellowstonensis]|uniref:J domain-containing protein n=1 Tax=Galdieria yellowstonensis TaxID=3028027 RepID=A0AAV9IJB2_9RHOD|nr:hypothetical protein GAYE_SCF39G5333 [Galdieria yellowstonensis]